MDGSEPKLARRTEGLFNLIFVSEISDRRSLFVAPESETAERLFSKFLEYWVTNANKAQ